MAARNAVKPPPPSFDPRSGFDAVTRSFRSLRPPAPLPPLSRPLSFATYIASLLPSPLPANPALVYDASGSAISFSELFSQVRSLAAALRSHVSLSKGHVAFVLAPTSLDIPPLYLALLSLGAVVSPANPLSSASELAYLVDLCRPRVAFATSAAAAKLPPHVATIILDSPRFQSLLAGGDGNMEATEDDEVQQSDVACIQYSSGTTGRVKAVAISHRSFISMVASLHATRDLGARRREQGAVVRVVLGAPLFHSMGFMSVLGEVALGVTTVLMGSGGGVRGMLQAAERYRATRMSVSTPVVVAMASWEEPIDLTALEHVICGGAPLHESAAKRFKARFPDVELCQGYGATETGGIARTIGQKECRNMRSVGRLLQNITEAKIVDIVTGESLSIGQVGELWVRGPSIMIGYVGNEEANASSFDGDGWLKTGDLCYFDADGFLYVVDRIKELIKYKAYQVPPAELEDLLQSLPGVADAAVIPYPDEEVGEIPMAFVVREAGSNLSEQQVMDFIAKQVAPYKKIRKVVFTNSIPKTASGKILRPELRNLAKFSSMSKL